MPPAASVAYADAISSGVTTSEPSVIEGYGCSGEVRIPSRRAIATMFAGPTSSARRAYTVLSDCSVAFAIDMAPAYVCSYVCTHHATLFSHVPDGSGL